MRPKKYGDCRKLQFFVSLKKQDSSESCFFDNIIRKKIVSSILSEALRWFPKEMLLQPLSSWSYPERLRFSYYRWYLLNPKLLICFFPFAGQEPAHHETIIEMLVSCAERGMAVWVISSGIDAICEKTENQEFLRRLRYLN